MNISTSPEVSLSLRHPYPLLCQAITRVLSVTIHYFLLFGIQWERNPTVYTLWRLVRHNNFEMNPRCFVHQQFIPFSGWVAFPRKDVPPFDNLVTNWWTLALPCVPSPGCPMLFPRGWEVGFVPVLPKRCLGSERRTDLLTTQQSLGLRSPSPREACASPTFPGTPLGPPMAPHANPQSPRVCRSASALCAHSGVLPAAHAAAEK